MIGQRPSGRGVIAFRVMLPGCLALPILALVLISAVAGCMERAGLGPDPAPAPSTTPAAEVATVARVADGDTFTTRERGTIRMIGVDTPETVKPGTAVQCFGPQASAHLKATLRPGLTVRLVYEAGPDGTPDPRRGARVDRFGRTLAYVFLTDGTFLNQALVEQGYARARYYPPNDDHRRDFAAAQAKAQQARRGLWAAC